MIGNWGVVSRLVDVQCQLKKKTANKTQPRFIYGISYCQHLRSSASSKASIIGIIISGVILILNGSKYALTVISFASC